MTYSDTVDYLFNKLPMYSRIGAAAYRKDLTNTIRLCDELGNPQHRFKTIHIAGTNGKGSVSHMLAAVLQTAGYKTGLYTSPHLKDFRERIRINGEWCAEDFVVSFTERIQPLINEIDPSFFEITVAMAFEYFAAEKVDIAVIETGLGGRLDSTNIITPELSIITNIGWDHMNLLGDTLEKIATEKAGIIKKDVSVVVGEVSAEIAGVFDKKFKEVSAPATPAKLVYAADQRYVTGWEYAHNKIDIAVMDKQLDEQHHFELDLPGIYQTKNLLTVLEAAAQLHAKGWRTDTPIIQKALKHVKQLTGLHGRWETIQKDPTVVLDVGHNLDGVTQIVRQLELTDYRHLYIIMGMVKDKEIDTILPLFPKNASYYFTQAQIPRALEATELQQKAKEHGLHGKAFPEVNMALQDALAHAQKEDMILVCGSVFLVGEVNV